MRQEIDGNNVSVAPSVAPVVVAPAVVSPVVVEDSVEQWNAQHVHDYLLPVDADAASACLTLNINAMALFELTTRDLVEKLKLSQMIARRKVEHAIAKLKDPYLQKRAKQVEDEAKTMRGHISDGAALVEEKKHLPTGVFVYVTQRAEPREFLIEVDNSLNPVAPIMVDVCISNASNVQNREYRFFVVPSAQVRLEPEAGAGGGSVVQQSPNRPTGATRHHVLSVTCMDAAVPWAFDFQITYSVATLQDWLKLENARKAEMVSTFKPLSDTQSIVDMESELIDRREKFVDRDFAPVETSLFLDPETTPANLKIPVQWKRPEEFCIKAKPQLFREQIRYCSFDAPLLITTPGLIVHGPRFLFFLPLFLSLSLYLFYSPNQVAQGRLGDCWFLAALSIIARYPALVLNLFETQRESELGVYCCRFMRGGKWKRVIVDDFFPCTPSTGWVGFDLSSMAQVQEYLKGTGTHNESWGPVYSRSKDGGLWVCVLEKCYAKLNRSYQALSAGTLGESLYDLTGAPCVNIFFPWMEQEEKGEPLFERILKAHQAHQLMGCSTRMIKEKERRAGYQTEKFGIVSRHAYSIIDVRRVGHIRLIRLRNPWGSFVWNGAWSDNSDKWTQQTKAAVDFRIEARSVPFHIFLLLTQLSFFLLGGPILDGMERFHLLLWGNHPLQSGSNDQLGATLCI